MVARYQHDNAAPINGLIITFAASVVSGAVAGYVLGGIGFKWMSLIIVWPIVMGVIAGKGAALGVTFGKLRNTGLAALLAGLGGATAVVASHHVEYVLTERSFVEDAANGEFSEDGSALDEEEAKVLFSDVLVRKTGNGGFLGFLSFSARQGTEVSRHGHSTKMDEDGTKLLWFMELLLGTALAAFTLVTSHAARRAFCGNCENWYKGLGSLLHNGPADDVTRVLDGSDIPALARTTVDSVSGAHVASVLYGCPQCSTADRVLDVEKVTYGRKGEEKRQLIERYRLSMADTEWLFKEAKEHGQKAAPPAAA